MNGRTLPGGGMINDRRTTEQKANTRFLIVGTDRVLSGWGYGPRRSIAAWPVYDDSWERAFDAIKRRSDMMRVRLVLANYRPRLTRGDHLSIYDNQPG
jgi:hypothetical protein